MQESDFIYPQSDYCCRNTFLPFKTFCNFCSRMPMNGIEKEETEQRHKRKKLSRRQVADVNKKWNKCRSFTKYKQNHQMNKEKSKTVRK